MENLAYTCQKEVGAILPGIQSLVYVEGCKDPFISGLLHDGKMRKSVTRFVIHKKNNGLGVRLPTVVFVVSARTIPSTESCSKWAAHWISVSLPISTPSWPYFSC